MRGRRDAQVTMLAFILVRMVKLLLRHKEEASALQSA